MHVRPVHRLGLLLIGAAVGGLEMASCKQEPAAPPPCCEQPEIPPGVASFTIVDEEVTGPSDGQKVIMDAALKGSIKRDQIYPVLHTLYRHAMTRASFEPIDFVANLYPSENAAREGSDARLIARISRARGQRAPQCDNRVPYDFKEQVDRAFAASFGAKAEDNIDDTCRLNPPKDVARYDENFEHKATVEADQERQTVTVTYPYLEMGKDQYLEKLKFTSAMAYWIEFVTSLFRKVPDLRQVDYVGVHNDEKVLEISISRQQFEQDFSQLQETVAAHAAVTFQTLGVGRSSPEKAEREQEAFKRKTYTNALSALPKDQVTIARRLTKGK